MTRNSLIVLLSINVYTSSVNKIRSAVYLKMKTHCLNWGWREHLEKFDSKVHAFLSAVQVSFHLITVDDDNVAHV